MNRWACTIRPLAVSSLRATRRNAAVSEREGRERRQGEKAAEAREKCKWSKIRGAIPA